MRRVSFVLVLLSFGVLLSAGCQSQNNSANEDQGIPYEICHQFTDELKAYYIEYGNALSISVLGEEDGVVISLNYPGMPVRVPFPDFVNATSIQAREIAEKLDVPISTIQVSFTYGSDKPKIIRWESHDGVSGLLDDSYDGFLHLPNQTVEDLVKRYGAMNWFYDLSGMQVPDHLDQYINDAQDRSLVESPSDQYVMERLSGIETVNGTAAVTKEHDPNGKLGDPDGYIGCVYFADTRLNSGKFVGELDADAIIDAGTDGGGAVEVFRTKEEAFKRHVYLDQFGWVGSHYVLGTVVIRVSESLSIDEQIELTETIAKALLQIN